MDLIQIITTEDGSHSLFNTTLQEPYHSIHGAVQESQHVFIKMGFDFVCERSNQSPIKILEIGFGTGLNALLACIRSNACNRNVVYTSLETYPLEINIWSKLNYDQILNHRNEFDLIHRADWNKTIAIMPTFKLMKLNQSVQDVMLTANYDLIFFDAFAPDKQPEMWGQSVLKKMFGCLNKDGVFLTYCAKGQVRRDLKAVGFEVDKLPGPPGKREMIRAGKPRNS